MRTPRARPSSTGWRPLKPGERIATTAAERQRSPGGHRTHVRRFARDASPARAGHRGTTVRSSSAPRQPRVDPVRHLAVERCRRRQGPEGTAHCFWRSRWWIPSAGPGQPPLEGGTGERIAALSRAGVASRVSSAGRRIPCLIAVSHANLRDSPALQPAFHFVAMPDLRDQPRDRRDAPGFRAPSLEPRRGVSSSPSALLVALGISRRHAVTVQDRIIRLENACRLQALAPDLAAQIGKLTRRQLVALRFASDAELPDLARRVMAGEFASRRRHQARRDQWRPDHLRV